MIAVGSLVVGIGRNEDVLRDAHVRPRKRFGNEHGVPRLQDPRLLDSDIERGNRDAREACQHYRAFLGDVARPARTINGESYGASRLDHCLHFQQAALASARAGAADRHKPETANYPRDVFAIAAEAGEHSDTAIAEQPGRWKNAAVPEGVNAGSNAVEAANGAFFKRDGHSQRAADEAHYNRRDPGNQADLQALQQAEIELASVFGCNGLIGHARILTCDQHSTSPST